MCLIVFAWRSHSQHKLLVAANRDEFYARPTEAAHFWKDAPHILAGRDLEQGGTWLGITTSGRFAALTNVRNPQAPLGSLSRGLLVSDFLNSDATPEQFLQQLQATLS
ncbi:MAG TPA: NRDE family protein, partial [Pseudomonadales bacterium]|nr:NRDE family protein [Pseudomonadales bacterium]